MSESHTDKSSVLPWLGLACGVGVSSIYYNQPLLEEIGRTFHTDAAHAGLVAMATQVGYAAGLLFFVPLGDLRERRSLMVNMFTAVGIALLLVAFSPTLLTLIITSVITGVLASVTHISLPIAPELAPPEKRGRAIGLVMTGLLLGVLLARTFAGWISELASPALRLLGLEGHFATWRVVFVVAAVVNLAFVPVLKTRFPLLPAKQKLSYAAAMQSLWTVFREEPILREASLHGALTFAAFSCFWNTLAFLLARHGLGAGVAGSFGIVGAAGALMASVAGKQSDRKGPRAVLTVGSCLLALSYVGLLVEEDFSLPVWAHLAAMVLLVILLDIGQQVTQIANQTRIFALRPEARSRINTVYMVIYFTGAATGSAVSAFAWKHWQWNGVCIAALGFLALAAVRHITGVKHYPVPTQPVDHSEDIVLEG